MTQATIAVSMGANKEKMLVGDLRDCTAG